MNEDENSVESSSTKREQLKTKIFNPSHWLRLLLMMLMFIILFYIVRFIVAITMVVQWVLVLLSGKPNSRLKGFTKALNKYCYQIMEFVSFNSDQRPFPLSDWPSSE